MKKLLSLLFVIICLSASAQRLQDNPSYVPSSLSGLYGLTFFETSPGSGIWLPARKFLYTDLLNPFYTSRVKHTADSLTLKQQIDAISASLSLYNTKAKFSTDSTYFKSLIDANATALLNVYTKSQSDSRYLQSFTEADPKHIVSVVISGTNTKTVTITLADATTVSGTFTDLQGSSGSYSLSTLSDVALTSPSTNQLLKYNGSNWVNFTPLYLSSESDPVWSGVAGSYRTKTQNDLLYAPLSHTHLPTDITTDAMHRFITDAQLAKLGNADSTFSHIYNVEAFGANGSDASDDYVYLQAAIDTCGNRGGGVVYFPKGEWRTSNKLRITKNNVYLKGAGMSRIAGTNAAVNTVEIGGAARVENTFISDLYFNPTVQKDTTVNEIAVVGAGSSELKINNIHFGRPNGTNTGETTTEEGKVGGAISIDGYSTNTTITNITGFGLRRFIRVPNAVDIFLNGGLVDMNYLHAVDIDLGGVGGQVEAFEATNFDFVNSQFNGDGINLYCRTNTNFSTFTNCLFDTHGTGVLIEGDCKGLTFVDPWTSARPNQGFLIRASGGYTPTSIKILGGKMTLSGKEGIRVEDCRDLTVRDATFAHSGYSTANLSCLYLGQNVTQAKITGNTGAGDLWPARLGATGNAITGIDIAAGVSKVTIDNNDFSYYATAIHKPNSGVLLGLLNTGTVQTFSSGSSSGGSQSSTDTLVDAAFTGANGTDITAYTPETGYFYSTSGSNALNGSGNLLMGNGASVAVDAGQSNMGAEITLGSFSAETYYQADFGIASASATSSHIRVQINTAPGSSTDVVLYIIVDGAPVANSGGTFSMPVDRKLSVSVVGGAITATLGTHTLNYTTSSSTGNTFRFGVSNNAALIDRIKVYKL